MRWLRLLFRFFFFVTVSLVISILLLLLKILGAPFKWLFGIFNLWKNLMKWGLGIKVLTEGKVPKSPGVIMANHRSYVDILLISSKIPAVFVAKASVKNWPIIGWGGNGLSTVWVNRSSKESRAETRAQLKKRLAEGKSVIIFPEGTTIRGPETLPFKPGMFHTVAKAKLPIYGLAIEYENPKIAWVDDDLFLPHFFEIFSQKSIPVKIKFSDPMVNQDGEQLRAQTQNWINDTIMGFRSEWDQ
ncbi:lysophospholipid acyltransferase family protein [Luteibaculum oceani]|uniref:1-acyl-sn-glycerol-3-phosphate acyltransferase n=1 Tax=Luteibaculum oceani TaxID=1294296 RepID=A0A5C6V5C2_9FLAO|nr:lysophospholipid acyltransferase family protein [Luteibaculum oceani]TXC78805.1 1-acyl-sn-glycerol-3-phosphate acyltransferase [Luteibaculum oceani]